MHTVLTLVLSTVLAGLPIQLWADSSPILPASTLEIPFNEDEPAVMQAKMEPQVLTFLQSVLRYAARRETPDGTISIELTGNHHCRLMIEYQQRQARRPT